jgi:hypothetical protein
VLGGIVLQFGCGPGDLKRRRSATGETMAIVTLGTSWPGNLNVPPEIVTRVPRCDSGGHRDAVCHLKPTPA